MIWLAYLAAQAAFLVLGLSTEGHHRAWLGGRPAVARQRRLRRLGAALLLLSFAAALFARGGAMGSVVWAGLVMLSAGLTFLALNFLPHRQERSA